MNESVLLSLRSVSTKFRQPERHPPEQLVLRNIDLDLHAGRSAAIVGVSGRGKTTILRILCGLARPNSGEVLYRGESLRGPTRSIGVVFQNYRPTVFDWLSVADNIRLGMNHATRDDGTVGEIAHELGIHRHLDRPAQKLSGGERQRVAIARALVQEPGILILDEPFSNLDAVSTRHLEDILLRMKETRKITLVVVSHDIREALRIVDSSYCLLHSRNQPQLRPVPDEDAEGRKYTLDERVSLVLSMLMEDHHAND